MKNLITTTIAATICASQAAALSCIRPDPARAFQQAAQAEESYVVLLGEFSFEQPAKRQTDPNFPQDIVLTSQFSGSHLGAAGFVDGAALDVTLEFSCAASWCGSIAPDVEYLTFVQQTPQGYVLDVGPCYSNVFAEPLDDAVQQVESCMRGEGCEEAS